MIHCLILALLTRITLSPESLKTLCKYIPDYEWVFASCVCKINEILHWVLFILICVVYTLYLEITQYCKNFFLNQQYYQLNSPYLFFMEVFP